MPEAKRDEPEQGRAATEVVAVAAIEGGRIARVLDAHGPLARDQLVRLVAARGWGPGRFRVALRVAVIEGGAVRLPDGAYGPPVRRAMPRESTSPAD